MTRVLGLGKVTREVFYRCVQPFIPIEKAIELDGATTNLKGNIVIAHSPSIGVPIEALGFFAFHYSATNVASKFGTPSHLIIGIYLPLNTTEKDLQVITQSLGVEARKFGVTITAGQTATYYGIEIPLLTATCMGKALRAPGEVMTGDVVLLAGEVGGEAFWLDMLSKDIKTEIWRNFTPLPVILSLHNIDGIRIMHDVSEGGIKGALLEITASEGYGLKVSSESIKMYPGVKKLKGDIFRAPTYGAFIIITDSNTAETVQAKCGGHGLPCSIIGEVTSKQGLLFDGQLVQEEKRTILDEIYGSYDKEKGLK
jgi:hydrogenase maturation factor